MMRIAPALLAPLAAALTHATVHAASVPGTANPWLAGMPDGTRAGSDAAPAQSPVLIAKLPLPPGTVLTFAVTGSVSNTPRPSGLTPDGSRTAVPHGAGAEHGIASLTAPGNSLVGVFLGDGRPDASPAPAALAFLPAATGFATLGPALKQPFFIGDGLTGTGSGTVQEFVVPPGATRLYLGTMDRYGWHNNVGGFEVTIMPLEGNSAGTPQTRSD